MKFYNRYFGSGYEELISYYPKFYRDVFEMKAILMAQGKLTDDLEANIEQTFLNNFVLTADEPTIKTLEEMLHITYSEPLTLDQRRHVVIGRTSGYGHIGEQEIRGLIANYTDKAVDVDFLRGVITVVITGEVFDEENLYNTLLRRIPAHLALNASVHVQREFRQELSISYGGAAGAIFKTSPVGEDRRASLPLPVAHGAVLEPWTTCDPPEPNRAAKGKTGGAGGVYYHTHIKSKLMG